MSLVEPSLLLSGVAGVQVDVAPRVVRVDRVAGLVLLGLEAELDVGRQAADDRVDLLVGLGAGDAAEASAELEVLDLLDRGLELLLADALGSRGAHGLLLVGVVRLRDEAGVGVGRADAEVEQGDEADGQGDGDDGDAGHGTLLGNGFVTLTACRRTKVCFCAGEVKV
ncbi:MAG: hypothetical protein A2534_01130 [Candidatus Magasanikbacteria bacterium RIFOXYD2_FULL_39_9]|uniref:Uncharacterized protein n=1 Tax=Candidatus Magasanikbacteria bacterium RIFOXYD1_FULL_40_23 TaxID=1798705 RepID=A0A1F6PAT7_9BACT|nr:MAG: hypothetical protein A2534_01130 [Candidatus Magasanikbacteria bacterium RIFOXYD2_FULL_39_9]OGH93279.1 MAG: hypothetical protein A2563_01590 [Candidatus Magasanikbacteria bacterium RIFOXYD1_FULL_40_23]